MAPGWPMTSKRTGVSEGLSVPSAGPGRHGDRVAGRESARAWHGSVVFLGERQLTVKYVEPL
jgi:hypothetical protein